MLFIPTRYAQFLREIRFGGGIAATIITELKHDKDKNIKTYGFLFLTTTNTYILYDHSKDDLFEIPIKDVKLIYYNSKDSAKLPKSKGSILNLFRHFWINIDNTQPKKTNSADAKKQRG